MTRAMKNKECKVYNIKQNKFITENTWHILGKIMCPYNFIQITKSKYLTLTADDCSNIPEEIDNTVQVKNKCINSRSNLK